MGGTSFDVSLIRDGQPELRNSTMINTYTVRAAEYRHHLDRRRRRIDRMDRRRRRRPDRPRKRRRRTGPGLLRPWRHTADRKPIATSFSAMSIPRAFSAATFAPRCQRGAPGDRRASCGSPRRDDRGGRDGPCDRSRTALMAQAMRLATVERGYDPRELHLYPLWAAPGPVHAVDLAT